jgi:MYXO-CTERM domain-containing protein
VLTQVARGAWITLSLVAGAAVVTSSALAAPRSPAIGGVGVRLVDVSANAKSDPLARSYIVDRVAPGTIVSRRIEISNTTRARVAVAVYPAGAELRRGNFAFAQGRGRNELSSWTSVTRPIRTLPPGARALDTVTVSVPKLASSGERYAVVWVEMSAPTSAKARIKLVNRVGIRLYLSVGPGGAPPANFVVGALTAERLAAGVPRLVARVRNNGRRTLDIIGALTLSDGPGGLRAGPFAVRLGTTLSPGQSEPAIVTFDKRLPRGPWRAQLRLSSGFVHRSSAATVTFPVAAGRTKPPKSNHLLLEVSALLALLAVGGFALVRSRRRASAR